MNTIGQTADVQPGSKPSVLARVAAGPSSALSVGPISNIGFWVAAAWVFISFSRFFDLVAAGYKIPGVVYYTMLVLVLVSGAIPRALNNRIAWTIVAFTIWVGVTLPFSVWRTNSLDAERAAFQSLVTFVAVSGLTITARQCTRMMYALGVAALVGAGLAFFYGSMETGRLELVQGSFKDPNEYAMTLLMGLPMLALLARSRNTFARVFGVGSCLVTLFVFLRAGSRGGMIALLVMGAVLFWGVSLKKKVLVLVLGAGGLLLGIAALPGYLQQRYFTFFNVDESAPMNENERSLLEGADVGSSEGRLDLLLWSLKLTARHPLFGVGPGNFPTAHWSEARDEGKRVAWNVSHNTYTQISSETGILGALLFIAFLVRALQAARRVVKNAAANGYPELERAGYHLWLSLTGVCAAAFFLSLGYFGIFYVLGAVALSLERAISPAPAVVRVPVRPAEVPIPAAAVPAGSANLKSPAAPRKIMSGKEVRALMRKV